MEILVDGCDLINFIHLGLLHYLMYQENFPPVQKRFAGHSNSRRC